MSDRRLIGLDIGSASVRAADVSVSASHVHLHNFGQETLPAGAVVGGEVRDAGQVTAAIQRLWKDRKFSQRNVVMGVANQQVVVRAIELPWVAPDQLAKSLPYLVADELPLKVDEAVLDFLPLSSDQVRGKPIPGLLVASSRENVTAMVRCAENAGLRPASVDLSSFALLRAVGRGRLIDASEKVDERRKPGPATEVLVDIGASVTNIVLHKGGAPQVVRIVVRGGEDITAILADRLGISNAEAEDLKRRQGMDGEMTDVANLVSLAVTPLLEEIRTSVDYYTSTRAGARVERVRVCGGGSLLRGLLTALHHELGLPVERADPLWEVEVNSKDLDLDELELFRFMSAVPIGLALGAT